MTKASDAALKAADHIIWLANGSGGNRDSFAAIIDAAIDEATKPYQLQVARILAAVLSIYGPGCVFCTVEVDPVGGIHHHPDCPLNGAQAALDWHRSEIVEATKPFRDGWTAAAKDRDGLEETTEALRKKLAAAANRELELHSVMAARLPHWIDPERGVPLNDAATFQAMHDIALRLEKANAELRERLAAAESERDDWQACVEAIEALLTGGKRVRSASIQAGATTAAQRAVAHIAELEKANAELRAALGAISVLDLEKNERGHDDFYSGPDRFFTAHRIAREALAATAPGQANPLDGPGSGEVVTKPSADCLDCGAVYGADGWCDVVIPDDVWNAICPEGGVLCFRCMTKRLEAHGYDCLNPVPVFIASGPYRDANEEWRIIGWKHGYKVGQAEAATAPAEAKPEAPECR
jgi:hypothetical protein